MFSGHVMEDRNKRIYSLPLLVIIHLAFIIDCCYNILT